MTAAMEGGGRRMKLSKVKQSSKIVPDTLIWVPLSPIGERKLLEYICPVLRSRKKKNEKV